MITAQQARTRARWPGTVPVLFPRHQSQHRRAPARSAARSYRTALYRWLARCDVRDEHGQPCT